MGAPRSADLDPRAVAFYRHVLELLSNADVPVLIGGAWAFEAHTGGAGRRTKDLDLFLRPGHVEAAVAALGEAGYRTEMTSPLWIAKALMGDDYVDLIFSSLAAKGRLDADRLLARFGLHWRVLLADIVLFDYCFPSKLSLVPAELRARLLEQAADLAVVSADGVDLCYGTFLSKHQYVSDVTEGGFVDARHA